LDGLPLALDQAGAYILETSCSFFAYHEQYTRKRAELLVRRGKRFIGHEASVATTFSLAFERIKQGLKTIVWMRPSKENDEFTVPTFNLRVAGDSVNKVHAAAHEILRVCSLLYGDAIPEEILQEKIEQLTYNENMDEALGMLQDYSLIQRNRETKMVSIHRLVQAVLLDEMNEAEKKFRAEQMVFAINAAFPNVEYSTWPMCERLLPQALKAAKVIEDYQIVSEEVATHLLWEVASYLAKRARYREAELLYQQALRILQRLGPGRPDVGMALNNLANIYLDQGKYVEAEPLYQQALRIFEQQLGPDHPRIAEPLNNLGKLYLNQGKYAEAEPLLQRALHVFEQQLGSQDPVVAESLDTLATFYSAQGKYVEAELFCQRALQIRKQSLGSDHPALAASLNNLAAIYFQQDKYAEAESLFQQALRIFEQQLGPDHPYVAAMLTNLATCAEMLGRT
jgi:tetratricopeptide (TPR) repeat protein